VTPDADRAKCVQIGVIRGSNETATITTELAGTRNAREAREETRAESDSVKAVGEAGDAVEVVEAFVERMLVTPRLCHDWACRPTRS
jgi:hypothetical protein